MSRSPRRLKRRIDDLVDKVECLTKKVKLCQQKARRLVRKADTLTLVVDDLKANDLVSSGCAELLESTFSAVPRELMKRLVSQKASKNPGAYPPELRAFAMMLKFYSTKAFNHVRESFDLWLPHVSVIRRWCSSDNSEPGFTRDALTAMKAKVLAAKRDGQEVVCSAMLDEMSIRKHVKWDGKRYRGFVDLGTGIADDDSLPASPPGPTVTVAWVLRGKHSRKRAVGPGRKCRKK